MPVAAAEPERNSVGIDQSGGLAELTPELTTTRAIITATSEAAKPAKKRPMPAAAQASVTCQVRSPVRSE